MNFVDIIGDIVTKVRAEYSGDEKPYYLYGHPIEIFNTLSEKSVSATYRDKKYPLIALFQEFEEEVSYNEVTIPNVTIVIMTETSEHYKANNRYTNTFTPTLIPLYNLLIKYIKSSKYVTSEDDYSHTKVDRLYWGLGDDFGNDRRLGNDNLDAIVITNLNLKIVNCN